MSSTVWRSDRPLTVYRIGARAHPPLDGAGAAASDAARWNSRGRFLIYAAEHYATALLEKLAQLNGLRVPRTLAFVVIRISAGVSLEEVSDEALPGWEADDKGVSQRFGDRWYDEERSLLLFVPSLAAPGLERNVLINQLHPEFGQVTATAPQIVQCHPKLLDAAPKILARSSLN